MNTLENLKTDEISSHGGARNGAGRKPKLQYQARELFNMVVDKHWHSILDQLVKDALEGDKEAIKMVVEQRIGRPSQSLEVKKQEVKVNYTLFTRPEVREAVRVFEDKLKKEIRESYVENTNI